MSIKRIVDTQFWEDGKVIDKFSVEDKFFMLYLMTNPHTTQLGIYKLPKRLISFETGYTVEVVAVLLQRFQDKYKNIVYNDDTQEIAVLNSLKYSVVKGGKPVIDLLEKELTKIDDTELIIRAYNHLTGFWNKSIRDFDQTIKSAFEKEMAKRKVAKEKLNENDNENDNEESYHDSYNDSYHDSSKPSKKSQAKPVRHKYGEYQNVLFTDQDLEKLKTEFPSDWQERIERLSSYIASTGKTYKNHLATIRNWARKDKAQPKPQQAYGQPVKREEMPNWDAQTTASSPSRKAEIEKMMEEFFIDNEEENR